MQVNFSEPILICYTPAGPTYRESALEKLKSRIKADNIHYSVITDNKEYFRDVFSDDITITELKEFYVKYPEIKEYEFFLETEDTKHYGDTCLNEGYRFSYSVMRFHIKIAHELSIKNIALLSTDSYFRFDIIDDTLLKSKNKVYFAVSWWPPYESEIEKINCVRDVIKDIFDIDVSQPKMIYDEAARFYVFDTIEFMSKFFDVYHMTVLELFKRGEMKKYFSGSYSYNEEILMSVIYNMLGITGNDPGLLSLFLVRHNPAKERPWSVGTSYWRTNE